MNLKKRELLSPAVQSNEPLARYIFSDSHFSVKNNRIKMQAFMPPKGKKTASVIRYKNCQRHCILQIGKRIEDQRGIKLKAVGSLLAKDAQSINSLKVESDISAGQHRRHANIIFGDCTDAKKRQIAQKLAQKACLLIHA